MRDVQHRDARPAELANDAEQPLAFRHRQGGGGLVHDDEARVAHERPRDADQPVFRRRKRVDVCGQRRADSDTLGDRVDVARDGGPVDDAELGLLRQTQHDVFQDRHAGHEGELLVDETHAEFVRQVRRVDCDALPVNDDLSAVGLRQSRKDPDQG